jgi:hypothetical protein
VVGERDEIEVNDFAWDYAPTGNVAHLARHGVSVDDVYAVLGWGPLYFRNLPGRRASHVMIGRDSHDRSLLITLLSTSEIGTWEPVTGWQSAAAHRVLEEEGRI